MIEPKPKTILRDELSQRITRVGLVLPEDKRETLSLTPKNATVTTGNGRVLKDGTTYQIVIDGENLQLLDGEEVVEESSSISLRNNSDELKENHGLSLSPIVAGRGFHWEKEIAALYPGDIEVHARDGKLTVINILPFESYLACVVVSEMSPTTPPEFIKAQVTAARSWAVCFLGEKHPGEPFDLCNDDDCQRYQGVTYAKESALEAAIQTSGEYLLYNDQVLAAYYSKSCGGITEDPEECFGFPVPGLVSVVDGEDDASPPYCSGEGVSDEEIHSFLGKVDNEGSYYQWEVTLSDKFKELTPLSRGRSGRIHKLRVLTLDNNGKEQEETLHSQYEIRKRLHESFLYSSAFEIEKRDGLIHLLGKGWGHGVGLCQIGAAVQALKGIGYSEILTHYFPKAQLEKVY